MKALPKITYMGILTTLAIVMTRFVQIPLSFIPNFNDRISLGFLPVALAGSLFGPFSGGIVAGAEDLIRALLFPQGDINLLFTLNAAIRGTIYGLLLKEMNVKNIIIASIIIFVLNNTFIISGIISIYFGVPFYTAVLSKVGVSAVNCIVQTVLLIFTGIPIERKLRYVRKQ